MNNTPRVDALAALIAKVHSGPQGSAVPLTREQLLEQALSRVGRLCETWENATDLMSGSPSIVARAFASELRAAIDGT